MPCVTTPRKWPSCGPNPVPRELPEGAEALITETFLRTVSRYPSHKEMEMARTDLVKAPNVVPACRNSCWPCSPRNSWSITRTDWDGGFYIREQLILTTYYNGNTYSATAYSGATSKVGAVSGFVNGPTAIPG